MSRAVLCLVAVLVVSTGRAQPPARDASTPAGTAAIRGRITDAAGRPLSRVDVRVASATGPGASAAMTAADGRYEISGLAAGTYTVIATKPNYVRSSWGEQRPEGPGQRFALADGERRESIDLRLTRAAAMTGRIVDEFGDPVTDAFVSAQRYQYVQGARRLMPSGRAGTTNDLGEFRVYGLTPGQYYLSATLRTVQMNSSAMDPRDRSGYAPTFYPGAGSVQDAQRLTVTPGQTISGMNWTLLPIQTTKITGAAFDIDGRPLTNGLVVLSPKLPGSGFGSMGGPLNDGRFTIFGVTPGEYVLRLSKGGTEDTTFVDVTVTGADMTDLQVTLTKPSTIRGRVVFTPSVSSAGPPKPTAVNVSAIREWAMGQPVTSQARIKDDGTFEISLVSGHVQLRTNPVLGSGSDQGPVPGSGPNAPVTGAAGPNAPRPVWRLNRVIVTDVDVADSGIEVPPNGAIENVIVEMTNHGADVTGRVTDAGGQVVRDCTIVIFAQDPAHWTVQTRFLSVSRPSRDDRFRARLLAGDYYAVAMSEVESNAWTDPDFLSAVREHAVAFSIADGETKTVDLRLSPAPVF